MNKKGFISISSVYAFFLVFLLLLLFTVNKMVSNRIMVNNVKNEVKEEISEVYKNKNNFAFYIKGLYTSQGTNGIYYHDASLINGAEDNSYRYSGANPNNYVCFGNDDDVCPDDYLYRIIGVFDNEVKLIKSTSYGNYTWDNDGSNTWNSTVKPDIRDVLNITYYNTLGVAWQNKITTHSWSVSGMNYYTGYQAGAQVAYKSELGGSTIDSMKIGLMYVSDYYYGATNTYWTYPGSSTSEEDYSSAINENWLYLGDYEWTISRYTNTSGGSYAVLSDGSMGAAFDVTSSNATRPCFYLTSSTTYVSGSGTSADPFRIN